MSKFGKMPHDRTARAPEAETPETPERDSLTQQMNRGEVRALHVLFPVDLHRKLKRRALDDELTMSEITTRAVRAYLADRPAAQLEGEQELFGDGGS